MRNGTSQKTDRQIIAEAIWVAQQICQLCQQCPANVDRYQQAAEKAGELKPKLKQLEEMLARASYYKIADAETHPIKLSDTASVSFEARIPDLSISSGENDRHLIKPAPPSLKVYCFGPFQVYLNDELITDWNSLKARSILKYLVTHKGAPVSKDTLMELFWPEANPDVARRNLHQAIYSLRYIFKQRYPDYQLILFENDSYFLKPNLYIWVDYVEFEHQVQAGQWLEQAGRSLEAAQEYSLAEALYRGDFLEENLYEDWTQVQREHLRNSYLDLTNRLSEYYLQCGEYTKVWQLCQKILTHDNCYEEAHRRLIRCYQAQGQRHLAVRQYQACVGALKAELEVPPSPETQMLHEQIIAGVEMFARTEPEVVTV